MPLQLKRKPLQPQQGQSFRLWLASSEADTLLQVLDAKALEHEMEAQRLFLEAGLYPAKIDGGVAKLNAAAPYRAAIKAFRELRTDANHFTAAITNEPYANPTQANPTEQR